MKQQFFIEDEPTFQELWWRFLNRTRIVLETIAVLGVFLLGVALVWSFSSIILWIAGRL